MDFYNKAGLVLDRLDARKGSLKSIVFDLAGQLKPGAKPHGESAKSVRKGKGRGNRDDAAAAARRISDGKRLLKVSIEVLRFREALQDIIAQSELLKKESRAFTPPSRRSPSTHPTPTSLATVLVHDLLFARRGVALAREHRLRVAIEGRKSALLAAKAKVKIARGVKNDEALATATADEPRCAGQEQSAVQKPRWLRVNTLKWTLDEALACLAVLGYSTVNSLDALYSGSESKLVYVDEDLPYLLALHPSTPVANLAAYKDGRLIIQDKASCFPPALLLADLGLAEGGGTLPMEMIDATAAPGNKTTSLGALLDDAARAGASRVWAFERDAKRFATLEKMVRIAGCKNVTSLNKDFLTVNPRDERFSRVSRILLDPSCSGSGIVSRLDHLHTRSSASAERLASLSSFQVQLLHHALRFPSVTHVAYSTCSLHIEEDEAVVARVLSRDSVRAAGWRVGKIGGGLRGWTRRGRSVNGLSDDEVGQMLRADPALDPTIGFFAVLLERHFAVTAGSAAPPQLTLAHGLLSPPLSDAESPSPYLICSRKRKRIIQADIGEERKKAKSTMLWRGIRPGRLIRGS